MLTDLNAVKSGAEFPLSDKLRMATYKQVDLLLNEEHNKVFR